jgi:NAD-dependent dihydropyrimidine dehydrogenase PreA subunit
MTYVIGGACIDTKDCSCRDVCPVDDCIVGEDDDRMLFINPAECIDCGACMPACPVDAIYSDDEGLVDEERPAEWEVYLELNRLYFRDRGRARSQVYQLKPVP